MELGDQKTESGRASEVEKGKWGLCWELALRGSSSYPTEMTPKGKFKALRS